MKNKKMAARAVIIGLLASTGISHAQATTSDRPVSAVSGGVRTENFDALGSVSFGGLKSASAETATPRSAPSLSPSRITGYAGGDSVSLNFTPGQISGYVGGDSVNLNLTPGQISGYIGGDSVSLNLTPGRISGYVGGDSVSLNLAPGRISGYIGGNSVSLNFSADARDIVSMFLLSIAAK